MEDTKDNGIIEKTEEVVQNIDPTQYKLVKKPTEKQLKARQANGERLKKIIEMKKADKEKIMKEHETKLVAELKEKWKKEYEEEKNAIKNNKITVPVSMIEKKVKSRVSRKKPLAKKEVKNIKKQSDEEDESSATEDDHIPSETEGDTTDTTIIKKKLAKVKQIEQVVSKQVVNPYLSLLEKYYK